MQSMHKFEILITHIGNSKEDFLSNLQKIDKTIEFGKRLSIHDMDKALSAVEDAIFCVDNKGGFSGDLLVVSLFKNNTLILKLLYHTGPNIKNWVHVDITSLDLG